MILRSRTGKEHHLPPVPDTDELLTENSCSISLRIPIHPIGGFFDGATQAILSSAFFDLIEPIVTRLDRLSATLPYQSMSRL